MILTTTVPAMVVGWYLLKAVGGRVPTVHGLVARLTPWTRGLHTWVLSAPATFCYIAVFTCFSLVQKTAPPRLIDIMTAVDSTNLYQLRNHTLSVLATSAFWVAGHGNGLALYIAGFATVVAWAERRYGTPRLVVIAASGHVFASLLTQAVLRHVINDGNAPAKLVYATDVGVSYMLVAGMAAAVLAMRGWVRLMAVAILLGILLTPMITSHTIWDLGHVIAAACGLIAAALCRVAGPLRTPERLVQRDAAEHAAVAWPRSRLLARSPPGNGAQAEPA
jgi:hypothetical protein